VPVRHNESAPTVSRTIEIPPLPVARAAESPELPVARFAGHGPSVQRAVNGSAPHSDVLMPSFFRPAEVPIIQREPEPPAPQPAPAPAPAPAPEAPAPAVQAPPPAAPQPETEELVKKLFDPLLRRLKTELRLDRERRGALTDRPH
jgi:pyruvate/2-oxoglutarate dehydrogenase complex dihydrolipoamide acyltransferase (E2) component